jgi:hypothetical protein
MISVRLDGMEAVQANLAGYGRQIPFAAAQALTITAHAVHRDIRAEMAGRVQGGATPYTLRAFAVTGATKADLTATVGLKTAQQSPGTPYEQSIGHLFRGGRRSVKRVEDWLRARGILPDGQQIAPGRGAPIDARGNVRRQALQEMLGVLAAAGRGLRNLRVYRKASKNKGQAAVGFFVALHGAARSRHLHPGIYRRIERGADSVIEPWFYFVSPAPYSRVFDLEAIARQTVNKTFAATFASTLEKAIAGAR